VEDRSVQKLGSVSVVQVVAWGQRKTFPVGTTVGEALEAFHAAEARRAVVARVNGELVDLSRELPSTGEPLQVEPVLPGDPDALDVLRHSTAHVMARAILRLFPGTKLAFGPTIENGFYYDVDAPTPITQDHLPLIEEEMRRLVARGDLFERFEVPVAEARRLCMALDQPYKVEHIDEELYRYGTLSFYRFGEFIDLCRGPHVRDARQIGPFKLLSVAGAYWKGDASRRMLQRVYGTAWFTQEELQRYLERLEEAKKRDHRVLGKQLQLFTISPEVGSGLVLWMPKGATVRSILETFIKAELLKRGYQPVYTPHIGRKELYERSGHLATYADKMYAPLTIDEEIYYLKPMNCPHHIHIYKAQPHSYRDLPVRLAEFGTVYRYEQSGELTGLLRVRGFTQDDAHLFCTPEQVEEEFRSTVELVLFVCRCLGLGEYRVRVGLRDPQSAKYVGDAERWATAEASIERVVRQMGLNYTLAPGEAAFYGPKVDFLVRDCLGREWQLGTVQLDYNLPERFELEYVGPDNRSHRPVMIHRAPFGSLERLMGILIEHYAGAFPLWLAPVQIRVLPISEKVHDYARRVYDRLLDAGFRAEVDLGPEKIGHKIRDAQLEKSPYMAVVGPREAESQTVALRERSQGDLGAFPLEKVVAMLAQEVAERRTRPAELLHAGLDDSAARHTY
jgi:threonyl-tRNA synthetase